MTHPAAEYLAASGEALDDFAARAGVSPARLAAIISHAVTPALADARRLAAATGGACVLEDFYRDSPARVVDALGARRSGPPDAERLAEAVRQALAVLAPDLAAGGGADLAGAAADAVLNTYDALGGVTGGAAEDRLARALRAVLEEILRDCGAPRTVEETAATARLLALACRA